MIRRISAALVALGATLSVVTITAPAANACTSSAVTAGATVVRGHTIAGSGRYYSGDCKNLRSVSMAIFDDNKLIGASQVDHKVVMHNLWGQFSPRDVTCKPGTHTYFTLVQGFLVDGRSIKAKSGNLTVTC